MYFFAHYYIPDIKVTQFFLCIYIYIYIVYIYVTLLTKFIYIYNIYNFINFANTGPSSQGYGFSSSHVWM